MLIATLALALFNASQDDVAKYFAYGYGTISICVLVSFVYRYPLLGSQPSQGVRVRLVPAQGDNDS